MAEVIPFRGVLYNPRKIDDMADVVAPPFDVISEQEQIQFHRYIRLFHGKSLTPV